jgi:hypothetical protein
MKKSAPKISAESLRTRLKLKEFETKALLTKKHPNVQKYLKFRGIDFDRLREHSAKLLSTSALAGALLLAPPAADMKALPTPQELLDKLKIATDGSDKKEAGNVDRHKLLLNALKDSLPENTRPLSREEEKMLEQLFTNTLGIPARASLEGEHLNTTYGYIGAEQHLRRYPGDTSSQHSKDLPDGMAPGLGAWGYFANSKLEMTADLEEKEKWYAVVQTLYLPDWSTRQPYLKDWYKYRKVVIVNTQNGNAVIADIADSGPAAWTGKQYGGSPEVMVALGGSKYKKGSVVVFFLDDPNNTVPLGPVEYN